MLSPTLSSAQTELDHSVQDVELADVVRQFGSEYTSRYQKAMLPSQTRALADIAACCTKQLGGKLYHCDDCRESFWQFHCCRNRACPKCHGTQTQQWLEKREVELLPCDYFHAVATVPSQLRNVFRYDQKFMYGLFMRVAAEAVKELCAIKRHLGGLPGILALLHTWNGELEYHPHVHMLITGGGITSDGQKWQPTRGEFLVPVRALSRKIAIMFRDALKKQKPGVFANIPRSVWRLQWVSFCKHYGRGNDAVLKYLSRYVFRTAISNARILAMDSTHVTFRYKQRSTDRWHTRRLSGVEFLRRFLLHVLPRGFHRVRYYGLWHHSKRHFSGQAWLLLTLDSPIPVASPRNIADVLTAVNQDSEPKPNDDTVHADGTHETPCCPHCGGTSTTLLAEYSRFEVP